MSVSGKQSEILHRDTLFLRVAQQLLLSEGYHALTMGKIAELTRFSKGTVYNRFTCKEELVCELGRRCREVRLEMIERAAGFEGRPRERMVALGEGAEHFARLYPEYVRVLHVIDAEAVLEKVPDDLRASLREYDTRLFNLMGMIVRDAIQSGDLRLPPRSTPDEISFALWAVFEGGSAATLGGLALVELGIPDAYGAIARACHLFMDGCGWQPLSSVCNYSETARRVRETLLPEESRALLASHPGASVSEILRPRGVGDT